MPVKKLPEGLKSHSLCPGCGHGLALRLIAEVCEEMGIQHNECLVIGVGCSCNANDMLAGDSFQCPHGRAAAVATGMKRTRPNMCVMTYQGDGDAGVIGLSETLNAAYRNEKITVFTINNTNFGMTGGQMSWTTLGNQVTTTTVHGRDCSLTGEAIHLPEIIANSFNVAYAARASLHEVKHITTAKNMVRNALQAQMNGEGYSIVEFLAACPTNWHLSPVESMKYIEDKILPVFPVGEFKKRQSTEGK